MTDDSRKQNKSDMEPSFDQFAEPRGMSMGWDFSNLPTNSGSKTNGKDQVEFRPRGDTQTPDELNPTETRSGPHTEVDFDPFPEPRTVPTNWNVSDLL